MKKSVCLATALLGFVGSASYGNELCVNGAVKPAIEVELARAVESSFCDELEQMGRIKNCTASTVINDWEREWGLNPAAAPGTGLQLAASEIDVVFQNQGYSISSMGVLLGAAPNSITTVGSFVTHAVARANLLCAQ